MAFRKLVFGVVLGLTAACRPLAEINAFPTSSTISVSIPSEIHPRYQERLVQCAVEQSDVAILINESSDLKSPDLRLQLGEPADDSSGFAALLGWEDIIVIANSETNIKKISIDELSEIFSATQPDYEVWAFPIDSPMRELFDRVVLEESKLTPYARLAPNPGTMLEMVSGHENAIGYLGASWGTENITIVELDPLTQSQLQLPVLGITNIKPEGVLRSILVCIQAEMD